MPRATRTSTTAKPRWQRRPADRSAELLAVAIRCFSEDGIESVSLDEIARQAGVTKGTFYHYFTSKDHLLQEIMRAYAAPRAHALAAIVDGSGSAAQRLEQLIRQHWKLLTTTSIRYMPRLLVITAARHPQLTKDALQHAIGAVKGAYRRCIDDGITLGEFRAIGGAAMVELCILPMIARTMLAGTALEKTLTTPTRFINAHCEVVLAALARSPGEKLWHMANHYS